MTGNGSPSCRAVPLNDPEDPILAQSKPVADFPIQSGWLVVRDAAFTRCAKTHFQSEAAASVALWTVGRPGAGVFGLQAREGQAFSQRGQRNRADPGPYQSQANPDHEAGRERPPATTRDRASQSAPPADSIRIRINESQNCLRIDDVASPLRAP